MNEYIREDLIKDFMKLKKLSKKEFCHNCNIPLSTLNKIFNNNIDFDIVYLLRICVYMNLPHNLCIFKT